VSGGFFSDSGRKGGRFGVFGIFHRWGYWLFFGVLSWQGVILSVSTADVTGVGYGIDWIQNLFSVCGFRV
jgi:hypothetical protein